MNVSSVPAALWQAVHQAAVNLGIFRDFALRGARNTQHPRLTQAPD
jgi:hypothetical protein